MKLNIRSNSKYYFFWFYNKSFVCLWLKKWRKFCPCATAKSVIIYFWILLFCCLVIQITFLLPYKIQWFRGKEKVTLWKIDFVVDKVSFFMVMSLLGESFFPIHNNNENEVFEKLSSHSIKKNWEAFSDTQNTWLICLLSQTRW